MIGDGPILDLGNGASFGPALQLALRGGVIVSRDRWEGRQEFGDGGAGGAGHAAGLAVVARRAISEVRRQESRGGYWSPAGTTGAGQGRSLSVSSGKIRPSWTTDQTGVATVAPRGPRFHRRIAYQGGRRA